MKMCNKEVSSLETSTFILNVMHEKFRTLPIVGTPIGNSGRLGTNCALDILI